MTQDTIIERLRAIISDDEIARVHGNANFGCMTPREVVSDGVQKAAVGYHTGHTQFCILREHGLITKPRPGSYDADLTKKGKEYARVIYTEAAARIAELEAKLATAVGALDHIGNGPWGHRRGYPRQVALTALATTGEK